MPRGRRAADDRRLHALAALEFGEFAGVPVAPSLTNIHRWYADFKKWLSAAA